MNNPMTLDELLMYEINLKALRRSAVPAWVFTMLLMCCALLTEPFSPVGRTIRISVIEFALIFTIYILRLHFLEKRYMNSLFHYSDTLPVALLRESTQGRNWSDGIIVAVECYQAHVPGDCQLCGAGSSIKKESK
jgi:hypothetical protein